MAYGSVKVDNIIFDNGGVDKLITVSGLFYSTSGALTVTGAISGGSVTAPTATFTTLTGTTTAGTTATFTSGSFTSLTGVTTTVTSGVFGLGSAAAPSIAFSGDANTGIYSPGADQVGISTSGTNRVWVDASGNIGFGTISPATKLQVIGVAAFGNGVGGRLQATTDSNLGYLDSLNNAGTAFQPLVERGEMIQFHTNTAGITPTEKFRIDSSGNVGIGVTPSAWGSPQKAMEFAGGSALSWNSGAPQWYLSANAYYNGTNWIYKTTAAANQFISNPASGNFTWYTAPSGTAGAAITFTQAMTLDASGNLGIGAAPSYQLDINRSGSPVFRITNGTTAGYMQCESGTTAVRIGSLSSHPVAFAINGSEVARIDTSGNLGIGMTNPAVKFHVNAGNARIQQADFTDTNLDIALGGSTTGNKNILNFRDSTGVTSSITGYGSAFGSSKNYALGFLTNSLERLLIDSSGNVGIGVTPSAWSGLTSLSIGSTGSSLASASNDNLYLTSGAYYNGTNWLYKTTSQLVSNYQQLSGIHRWNIAPSGTAGAAITFTQAMTLDASGNLRIGTTGDGSGSTTGRIRLTGNTGGINSIYTEQAVSGGYNFVSSTVSNGGVYYHVNFLEGGTQRGSITSNGVATIYSTSSDYRLKENVTPVFNGIARFKQLKPSRFNFISHPGRTVDGFLAHEAQAVVPECVIGTKDAVDDDGNPVFQGIDQSKLVPLLTAALQEAITKIEALETRLTAAGIE